MKIALVCLLLLPTLAFGANAWNERDLSWTPSPSVVTGYKIEVAGACAATTWNVLVTVGNVTSYHVTNLKAGTYCFRARATSEDGDSDPGPTGPTSTTTVAPPVPVKPSPPGTVLVTP